MKTSFDQHKLQPAFTLNIVQIIQRIQIQSNPRMPTIPVGVATVGLLTLLCLTATFDPFRVIGSLVGAPLTSDTKVTKVGEIPTEVVVLSKTSILSSSDSKKDLAGNPQSADGIQAANDHTETETAGQNEPYTRLGNGTVHTIAYSPDGSLIAVAGKSTWLYDANTLAEVGMIRAQRTHNRLQSRWTDFSIWKLARSRSYCSSMGCSNTRTRRKITVTGTKGRDRRCLHARWKHPRCRLWRRRYRFMGYENTTPNCTTDCDKAHSYKYPLDFSFQS